MYKTAGDLQENTLEFHDGKNNVKLYNKSYGIIIVKNWKNTPEYQLKLLCSKYVYKIKQFLSYPIEKYFC